MCLHSHFKNENYFKLLPQSRPIFIAFSEALADQKIAESTLEGASNWFHHYSEDPKPSLVPNTTSASAILMRFS